MVYRRKRTYRRKYPRRKRVYKRRVTRRKYSGGKIFAFKRKFEATGVIVMPGTAFSQIYSFSLGNVPSSTDYTNLFDMYRITGVKLTITPNTDSNDLLSVGKFNMFSVIDYNDLSTITVVQAEQYQNCKRTISTRVHSRYIKPKIAIQQSDVSATAFTASYRAPWISTTNINVAHGFIKMISDVNPNAVNVVFKVDCTMYMQFKNVN